MHVYFVLHSLFCIIQRILKIGTMGNLTIYIQQYAPHLAGGVDCYTHSAHTIIKGKCNKLHHIVCLQQTHKLKHICTTNEYDLQRLTIQNTILFYYGIQNSWRVWCVMHTMVYFVQCVHWVSNNLKRTSTRTSRNIDNTMKA